VAHSCNPSYSGGRDQEDLFEASPTTKKASQKRDGGVAQGVDPEFKPQYCKKKKRERERKWLLSLMI
jgi:hypothetical protein